MFFIFSAQSCNLIWSNYINETSTFVISPLPDLLVNKDVIGDYQYAYVKKNVI